MRPACSRARAACGGVVCERCAGQREGGEAAEAFSLLERDIRAAFSGAGAA